MTDFGPGSNLWWRKKKEKECKALKAYVDVVLC